MYNSSSYKGLTQIITGGAGARLHTGPEKGGFHHYVIVDVKDSGICEITTKDIEGKVKDNLVVNK